MHLRATATTLLALLALPACGDDMDMTTDPTTTGSPTGDPTGATDGTTTADPTTTNGPTDPTTTTDATTTNDPTDATTTDDPTGVTGLSFAKDVWDPILSPSCSCHQLGSSGGLMMGSDAPTAYMALVGVASTGSPLNYVTASSSADSYLFHKVNNSQVEAGGGGSQMPLGGMLMPDQVATIKQWIDEGALP